MLATVLATLTGQALAAVGSWQPLGFGCCTDQKDGDGEVLFDGSVSECTDVCQAFCLRYGDLCGYVNHGWQKGTSTRCTVLSRKADVKVVSGPKDCGSGGDSGVQCYMYHPPPTPSPAGTWEDLGDGCCEAPAGGSVLFDGNLSLSLQACQAKCLSFGSQCGVVSHGWANNGRASARCQVLAAGQKFERSECGARCYRFKLPAFHGTWVLEPKPGCCEPKDPCDFLYQGRLADDFLSQRDADFECRHMCNLFGDLCGYVNYGWVIDNKRSTWCSVISAKAVDVTVASGPKDCGSCGDCGVHCRSFRPAPAGAVTQTTTVTTFDPTLPPTPA